MKNNKGSVLVLGLIIIIIVLLGVGGFLYYKNKELNIPTTVSPVPIDSNSITTPVVTDPNTIIKSNWGISFTKNADWNITKNTIGGVTLAQISGEGAGDTMSIDYVSGQSITDTDAKFGTITFSYDSAKQTWVETDDMNGENVSPHTTPTVATPISYTTDNLPVFGGTRRWLTYIVPLSHTTFLKLNITGSGYTQSLEDLLKTIKKI